MKRRILVVCIFILQKVISLHAQPAFTIFNTTNSSLPDNTVEGITIDHQGKKWIGTDYGLAIYNDTAWTIYQTTNSGISDNYIKCITFDAAGNAWIGTFSGGANKFDGTTWTVYNTLNSGISSDEIHDIAIDSLGNKWIGTDNGLDKFNDTVWTNYNVGNSNLPVNNIGCIGIESNTLRWIGTINGGLVKMADTVFTTYNIANSAMPDNLVHGLVRLDESLLISVDEMEKEISSVSLYPNPARDELSIICNTLYGNEFVEVFNTVGENIFKSEIKNPKSEINVSAFPNGIYFLRINSERGTFTGKFVKAN